MERSETKSGGSSGEFGRVDGVEDGERDEEEAAEVKDTDEGRRSENKLKK